MAGIESDSGGAGVVGQYVGINYRMSGLGVRIYNKAVDLFEGNIGRALRSTRSNLDFWASMPLSVAGRVALLKIITLPRLLYYFVTLPIWIPGKCFAQFNSMVSSFLWGTGRRRVSLPTMMLPRWEGGFAVPDLRVTTMQPSSNGSHNGWQGSWEWRQTREEGT